MLFSLFCVGATNSEVFFGTDMALNLTKSKTSKGKPKHSFKDAYAEKWLIMIAVDDVILVCLYICRECLCSDEVF